MRSRTCWASAYHLASLLPGLLRRFLDLGRGRLAQLAGGGPPARPSCSRRSCSRSAASQQRGAHRVQRAPAPPGVMARKAVENLGSRQSVRIDRRRRASPDGTALSCRRTDPPRAPRDRGRSRPVHQGHGGRRRGSRPDHLHVTGRAQAVGSLAGTMNTSTPASRDRGGPSADPADRPDVAQPVDGARDRTSAPPVICPA
jgi:hypothetical protein